MVIKLLNEWFTRCGIPEKTVSDYGRQFDSWEFRQFAEKLDIEHITSSPRYPQSNDHAENAVKTVKKNSSRRQEKLGTQNINLFLILGTHLQRK